MNRLERLFAISEMIRTAGRQPVRAGRLAERFDVSQRTIERDLASLREAGAPIIGEPGRGGGTVRLDDAARVVVSLSTTEVTALLMAVATAGPDMPYADDAAAGAATLHETLPENTRHHVDELRRRVRCEIVTAQVPSRLRRTVEEAVRRGVVVNIDYVDAAGAKTERSVEALGFYQGRDGWYLNGWCRRRGAGRIFRLDRIGSARLTRERVTDRDIDEVLGWVPSAVGAP